MSTVVTVVVALLAIAGFAIGGRHLYLRLDRPGGFECSLRVTRGEVPGLGAKFVAGYAGPEMRQLLWRRIAWPGAKVRLPIAAIRVDQRRRPRSGERLAIPASFSVIPVELDEHTALELAMPSRRIAKLIARLGNPGSHH